MLPRTDRLDKVLAVYRARAREHYPNLLPAVLARHLALERGLVLSEADIVAILVTRDARQRAQGAASVCHDDAGLPAIITAILKRLGL